MSKTLLRLSPTTKAWLNDVIENAITTSICPPHDYEEKSWNAGIGEVISKIRNEVDKK